MTEEELIQDNISDIDDDIDDDEENAAIVLDNGSGVIKAGFSGDDAPRAVFNNVIGRAAYRPIMLGMGTKEFYVGDELTKMRGILSLRHPITHGVINNFDDMEKIWHYAFNDLLKIDPSQHNVLITEAPLNPVENRERMISTLFETFEVKGSYVNIQAVLALYASGRTTGIVLDSGDGVTHAVPIFEGYALPHAMERLNIGGRDITNYMAKQLTMKNGLIDRNNEFISSSAKEFVSTIKEDIGYCAIDFDDEYTKSKTSNECQMEYKLPDGTVLNVNNERFECAEILYNPLLIGKEVHGIHHLITDSIFKCEMDLRNRLFENIILSGGTTTFKNFEQRLTNEIINVVGPDGNIKIIAPPERKYTVWIGGSILSSLSTFQELWITKEEYEEEGPNIVHRKCF